MPKWFKDHIEPNEPLYTCSLIFTGQCQPHSSLLLLLVYQGCHNRIPQTGWLKQQKFMFSQFWRLQVQDQGAIGAAFLWGRFPACRQLPSHCILTWLLCVLGWGWLISGISSSYKDTSPIKLEPTLWPHLTLITTLKAVSPNTVTLGVRASTCELGERGARETQFST